MLGLGEGVRRPYGTRALFEKSRIMRLVILNPERGRERLVRV